MQLAKAGATMAQQDGRNQYEETTDPKNPPSSVLSQQARRATVTTFLGGIIVFFLIVGAALIYWNASTRRIDPDPGLRDTGGGGEVGTVGDRDDSPGGFNPAPRPGTTQDELDYRGNIGAPNPRPFTELDTLLEDKPGTTVGRRVDLNDVDVASAQPGGFWIHDGNARVEVLAPDAPNVRAGQSVDVTGTIESNGADGIRIRADRVTAR
jgi:hypothetical protein